MNYEKVPDKRIKKTYCVVLERKVDLRKSHYRFDPDIQILFSCGASLAYEKLVLYTNYPLDNKSFDRNIFHGFSFTYQPCEDIFIFDSPVCNWYVSLTLSLPGSYAFFVVDYKETVNFEDIQLVFDQNRIMPIYILAMGYVVIDPCVRSINNISISLNQISIQTVISRCLGPIEQWPDRLLVSAKSGYNAIHFTPFQMYGKSGSCYSINNHLYFDLSIATGSVASIFPAVAHKIRDQFNCLIVDIVLNHVSNDCELIKIHSECFYNLFNCPYLRPSFLVDRAIHYLTVNFLNNCDKFGKQLTNSDIKKLEKLLLNGIQGIRLVEFFIVDVSECVEAFKRFVQSDRHLHINHGKNEVLIIQDELYTRLGSSICYETACNKFLPKEPLGDKTFESACCGLRNHLCWLNQQKYNYVVEIINEIVRNVIAHIQYHFIDSSSPSAVSIINPLVPNYFSICVDGYSSVSMEKDEEIMNSNDAKYIVANQGWVIGDSTSDFAVSTSEVYIRRQLIAWGDCAKIKWGTKACEPIYIWKYMQDYVELLARHVDGFRIDNCHSTPMHVLEYLIDRARKINPNLIVIGELFTNSELEDNLFVNRIGLTCLIRERMSAHDLTSLCHIVHRFGGDPIGSFFSDIHDKIVRAKPAVARAILSDMTHDNECLSLKHSSFEYTSTSAFIMMANCPVGSVRGFDEMIPYQINVVDETKLYSMWSDEKVQSELLKTPNSISEYINANNMKGKTSILHGIVYLKNELNKLHLYMNQNGYNQIFIDQITSSIVTVTRNNPDTSTSFVLISHHCFNKNSEDQVPFFTSGRTNTPSPVSTSYKFPRITIPGIVTQIEIESYMYEIKNTIQKTSTKFIHGTSQYHTSTRKSLQTNNSQLCDINTSKESDPTMVTTFVDLNNFPPSSIIILRVKLHEGAEKSIHSLKNNLQHMYQECSLIYSGTQQDTAIEDLTYSDVNTILFKCNEEEQSENSKPFNVPEYGTFVYNGLYGIQTVLSDIKVKNDLGHPLCKNLRQGYWLLDYIINRMHNQTTTRQIDKYLKVLFDDCKRIPKHLLPSYFEISVKYFNMIIINWILSKLNKNFVNKDCFTRKLAISTFALIGSIPTIHPPPLSLQIKQTLPAFIDPKVTITAGLPCFATSWSRVWGRDILISLKGLCLLTGRVEEARITLLSIAGTLRHGLIPNLISDSGQNPRYNARDATWFFLNAIETFCKITESTSILLCPVLRIFSDDESDAKFEENKVMSLADVVQEILQKHWDGINFVERNHGRTIDKFMKEEGFHILCGINHETGFVYGGNRWNCGTWMDKMGSSVHAANLGFPSTPRDGSAIELVALCSSAVLWLEELNRGKMYPYDGVMEKSYNKKIYWNEINNKICDNFEKYFWVPKNRTKALNKFHENGRFINKVGIYKDSINSSLLYTDFQLRPNVLIAMVVAPHLFNPSHAVQALKNIHKELEGLLGMATLDKSDWNYRGYYRNGDTSADFHIGDGFNYHQGPEWIWLSGYYIKALLHFYKDSSDTEEFLRISRSMLCRLYTCEEQNSWLGIPELTQYNGQYCESSSPIQSWSVACVLDALKSYYSLTH